MAAPTPGNTEAPPERRVTLALENLLIEIQKSVRAVSFYPPTHPILKTIHQTSFELVRKAAHYFSELEIEIGRQNVTYKGTALGERNESVQALGQHLFRRRVKRFILQEGISFEEYQIFLRAAALDPEEVYLRGGLDTILMEGHVRHIWMNQVDFDRLRRIESGEEEKAEEQEAPPLADPALFLDTATLDTKAEDESLSPEEQSLAKVLPVLDQTNDPNKYYEGVLLLASLAERFMADHAWKPLFSIVSRLEQHSSDPRRGVEFKKYSYRALRKITTPEVL
ncbi:MAG: hypothetical protein AB1405_18115, partial [Bdellovibrionota bacterium]